MPVREALRALEAEGLVKIKAHSGAWVSGLDQEEFEQCYKLREVVERAQARSAVFDMVSHGVPVEVGVVTV